MATTYYEITVKGDDKLLKGFVRGFQLGRSIKGGLWICSDYPIDTKHLREVLTFRGDHTHFISTATARKSLINAVKQAVDLDFEIVSDRRIARVCFKFEFSTFSRDAASKIKRLLDSAPPGIKPLDHEPHEIIDAKARGVELYSPVHEYRFRGKGRFEGDLETLLSFRKKLAANEFFEVEDIVVEH